MISFLLAHLETTAQSFAQTHQLVPVHLTGIFKC